MPRVRAKNVNKAKTIVINLKILAADNDNI